MQKAYYSYVGSPTKNHQKSCPGFLHDVVPVSTNRGHHRLQTLWLGLARWGRMWRSLGVNGYEPKWPVGENCESMCFEVDLRNILCENMMKYTYKYIYICYVCVFRKSCYKPKWEIATYTLFLQGIKPPLRPRGSVVPCRVFGSRNWRLALECPPIWRWNAPKSVENDWSWKSAKHALFPIWRLGSLVKVGKFVVTWRVRWLDAGETVGYGLVFFNDMPNLLGICLASPMSPNLKLWKKFKKFTDHHFHQSLPRVRGYVWGGHSSLSLLWNFKDLRMSTVDVF